MSMFLILTQEGWTELMNDTILRTSRTIGPLVAIYFVLYHLFVSLVNFKFKNNHYFFSLIFFLS